MSQEIDSLFGEYVPYTRFQSVAESGFIHRDQEQYAANLYDFKNRFAGTLFLNVREYAAGKGLAHFSADDLPIWVQELVSQQFAFNIKQFNPDLLIGVPNGGTVAREVAKSLNQDACIQISSTHSTLQDPEFQIEYQTSLSGHPSLMRLDQTWVPYIHGKSVALVTDVIYSGNTITHAIDLVKRAEPSDIFVGTLLTQSDRYFGSLVSYGFDMDKFTMLGSLPMFERNDEGNWVAEQL